MLGISYISLLTGSGVTIFELLHPFVYRSVRGLDICSTLRHSCDGMSTLTGPAAPRTGRTAPATRAAPAIDAADRRLLELLAVDGRLSVAGLAEAAGISRGGAYARLERLRSDGLIEGFSARVNPGKLGLGVTALVLISGRQPAWRNLREQLQRMPEVEYCAFTTGEYDALILVRVPDVETLRDVILERLQAMEDVRATQTIFVLDEVVRRPFVLPQEQG
jgi:Lrp/AsnC family leucine-responsive transcriptional regulator